MCTSDQQWNATSTNTRTTSYWSRQEDKIFERLIVEIPDGVADRWHHVARFLPGKTPHDVAAHYEALLEDVRAIEAGLVDPLGYPDEERVGSTRKRVEGDRKKGKPWTVEEHRNFLKGMEHYGKGDWRSISRNYVISRTPTQVASHAQKYFLRQSQLQTKERKRSSIHDITTGVDSVMVDPPTLPNNHENPAQFEIGVPMNSPSDPGHFQDYGNAAQFEIGGGPMNSPSDPGHFQDIGNPPTNHDDLGHFQEFGNPPTSHDDLGHFQEFGNPPNGHDSPGNFQDYGNPANNYDDHGNFQNFDFGHPMQ